MFQYAALERNNTTEPLQRKERRGEELRGLEGAGPSHHSGQGYSKADSHCFRGPITNAQEGCA